MSEARSVWRCSLFAVCTRAHVYAYARKKAMAEKLNPDCGFNLLRLLHMSCSVLCIHLCVHCSNQKYLHSSLQLNWERVAKSWVQIDDRPCIEKIYIKFSMGEQQREKVEENCSSDKNETSVEFARGARKNKWKTFFFSIKRVLHTSERTFRNAISLRLRYW